MYAFDYARPADRAGALAAITGDARFLAGGQSLVQMMKLRIASAEKLVDLGAVADLKGIRTDATGVTIGAMASHAEVAASDDVQRAIPALAELAGGIGDPMVRNRGTIGGSIANADPAACYPAGLVGLGATVHTSRRQIPADAFFTGVFSTALEAGELVTAVHFPPAEKAAYVKYKQPASRFALVGVFVSRGAGGVRVAVTGARGSVFRCAELEAALRQTYTADAARSVKLPSAGMNADLHGSAEYRAAMVVEMAARAVAASLAR
jgi:carbon-monoxide dehydrogenase medium subunit